MKHHNLKSFTKQFQHVVDGKKRSEIRFDDRQYEIGDVVRAPVKPAKAKKRAPDFRSYIHW